MEDPVNRTFTKLENGELITYDICTGEVISRHVHGMPAVRYRPYTFELGQMIIGKIREGLTVTKISASVVGLSASLIYHWRSLYPDFRHGMDQARRDRAHFFHDKIVEEIEQLDGLSRDELPAKRLKIDTMKWVAEKGNPADYGSKTTIAGDVDNPIGITVISTGIVRQAVEAAPVQEAEFIEVTEDVNEDTGSL